MSVLSQGIASPDLERQLDLLKHYPEIAEAHFRPAIQGATDYTKEIVLGKTPLWSGFAQETLMSKVTGRGLSLRGRIGWGGAGISRSDAAGLTRSTTAWYMNILEYGSPPHEINSHVMVKGQWVTIGSHPGFAPRWILRDSLAQAEAGIISRATAANEAAVRDLAVP
jgi:hypothetical protein